MSGSIWIGLTISGLGLGITFLSLGLLILLIRLLVRLFPGIDVSAADTAEERGREELAASMAVAIGLAEQEVQGVRRDPALGKLLEEDGGSPRTHPPGAQ